MEKKTVYRILAMRFSSLGDVALTVPLLAEFIRQNPHVQITFLSREKFSPLFEDLPQLTFISADLEGKHKGVRGIYRLYKELRKNEFDGVADLHNVLRTKILRLFFAFGKVKSATLDKGRNERKALTKLKNKIRKPLKPMIERYADVFRDLGFDVQLSHRLPKNISTKENAIGIAPIAMYEGKMYPLENTRSIAVKIAEKGIKVYLFGGKSEAEELEKWAEINPNIVSVAGKFSLKEELSLIKKLKLMVSMDSANMHLASMVGTRVISIWGNTHPYMGFLGYGQSYEDVIQDETLTQRPTSVFGKEPEKSKHLDYFKKISPEMILEKVNAAIH